MIILDRKMDRELVWCKGTDIPIVSSREFWIYGRILELIELKNTDCLTMDEIFDDYTFSKKERFMIISRLIKHKLCTRKVIDHLRHKYIIIPKISYRDSTSLEIYKIPDRSNRRAFIAANQ